MAENQTSNIVMSAFQGCLRDGRLWYTSMTGREVKKYGTNVKAFFVGVPELETAKVNPPADIEAKAHIIAKMKDGRRLRDEDKWTLALAVVKGAVVVFERIGPKADKFCKVAGTLGVAIISLQEFVDTEARPGNY